MASLNAPPDFRVALDFGTSYTCIAFVKGEYMEPSTIEEFPGDQWKCRWGTQVPTEIWYRKDFKGKEDEISTQGATRNILYGYEIMRTLELPDSDRIRSRFPESGCVTNPKLLLQKNSYIKTMRDSLMSVIRQLKQNGAIMKNEDIIEHLLICFLGHTKRILRRDYKFGDRSTVEVTLCVPLCWDAMAIQVMNSCLQRAIKRMKFGADDIPRRFIVNEAEAAAAYALDSNLHHLKPGETFIMLDCGGGTTDVGTYTISHSQPLRLDVEVGHPTGAICGSRDLNERMRSFALLHMSNEDYLADAGSGMTIANIIDAEIMPNFEDNVKRWFDISETEAEFLFRIRGLRLSSSNPRLQGGTFVVSYDDMKQIFIPSLKIIDGLMLEQIQYARSDNVKVDKVVLVGGFGDSPSLRKFLQQSLEKSNEENMNNVELLHANIGTSAVGVAAGAIMRARNKESGPKRTPQRSIGMIRHIPWEEDQYSKEVLRQPVTFAEISQREYIKRTILWLIKAGQGEIKAVHTMSIISEHEFRASSEEPWVAEEELFISDTCTEDHFTRHHKKNRGKTAEFGTVEFNLDHLRDVVPHHKHDNDWCEVILRINLKVIDRYLEFTAHWPHDDENAAPIPGSHAGFDLSSMFPA